MISPYHFSVAALIGALLYYVLHIVSQRKRMGGAKPPPGPKGIIHSIHTFADPTWNHTLKENFLTKLVISLNL